MAQPGRSRGRRKNNSRNHRPRSKPCQMCKRPARGGRKRWHNLLVCRGCYKTLCNKFISGENLRKKVLKSLPPQKPKGFWETLFGR